MKPIGINSLVQVLCLYVSINYAQRLPPGVNPQHYQQQQGQYQQHQQFQQVPVQHVPQHQVPQQNIHQQQQQVPIQHQQQVPVQQHQVPVQQPPVQHQQQGHGQHPPQGHQQQGQHQQGHHHAHAAPQPGQLLNAANIANEKDHIQEHLDVPIDTSKMSEQELQFHYFKMHDADNNNKLDGCELIKSLIHWHDPKSRNAKNVLGDEEVASTVDFFMEGWDLNKDGYVDYTEFKILSRGKKV